MIMDYLKRSLEKLQRLNPPSPFKEDPNKPLEGVLLQLIIELEKSLHDIHDELEYLTEEVEKLKEQ